MEKQLQIFKNAEFGEVRTVVIDNEPWFAGKDVAAALSYERGTKAVVDHVDEDDRKMLDSKTQSYFGIELGQRGGWLINESGLYSLILSSKLPTAKKFKHWVTSEVLPAIRKTGSYSTQPVDDLKVKRLEVMQRNANAKVAKLWLQISNNTQNQTYKEICNAYAANVLAEKEILALPVATEKTYSAAEIGKMLDISASKVGRIANANGLKTEEYGRYYHDKSRYSNKEVETFRYYECAIDAFQKIIAAKGGDDYVA